MARYRTLCFDYTPALVREVTLDGLKFSARLKGVGTASGRLKLPPLQKPRTEIESLPFTTEDGEPIYLEEDGEIAAIQALGPQTARANALALKDAVDPNRRQLVIEREGAVVFAGMISDAPYDDDTETIDVSAAEDFSVLDRRYNDRTRSYTIQDQLAIARSLVTAAKEGLGGHLGIDVGTETSGVLATARYERFKLQTYAELIGQLADTENGFDWAIDPYWDPATGQLRKAFRIGYPRRGRNASETGLVFTLGKNIESFKWPNDGSRQATKVWGTGAGQEDSMLIASQSDPNMTRPTTAGGGGYRRVETLVSFKNEETQAGLNARVRAKSAAFARPVQLAEITVNGGVRPRFGTYVLGDACRIVIPPNMTPYFPDGLVTHRRIVGWDVTVGDAGEESVKLILGEEPGG